MDATTSTANPLARAVSVFPAGIAAGASASLRVAGAVLLASVAAGQAYDPTQAFALIVAAAVLATLLPPGGRSQQMRAGFGAGLVFFAGTVLTHMMLGVALLAVGATAGLAGFAAAHRSGRDVTLPAVAFVAAALFSGGLQAAIVFWFE